MVDAGLTESERSIDAMDRTSGRHPSHPALGAVTSGSMLH
jgi:hypothetical protein